MPHGSYTHTHTLFLSILHNDKTFKYNMSMHEIQQFALCKKQAPSLKALVRDIILIVCITPEQAQNPSLNYNPTKEYRNTPFTLLDGQTAILIMLTLYCWRSSRREDNSLSSNLAKLSL